jgi:flagellar basal-body rod protein FlgF
MLTELVRQDALTSDLSNASTPGYKPEDVSQASFGDVLLANSKTGQVVGSMGGQASISRTTVDMTQGPLESTGAPLDVALQGPGFLTVQSAQGTQYTRDGQLTVDAQSRLTTATGDPILDTAGKPITIGAHSTDVAIAADGKVTAGGKTVGTIAIASLTNPSKIGDNLFTGTPGAKPANTTVIQGSLEGSAVNSATVMIDMIVSLRAYESSQKVIHSIDETLSRGIDSAGSTGG